MKKRTARVTSALIAKDPEHSNREEQELESKKKKFLRFSCKASSRAVPETSFISITYLASLPGLVPGLSFLSSFRYICLYINHLTSSRIECASTKLCHHSISPTSRVLSRKSGPREALEGFSQCSIALSPFVWLLAPTSYLLPYQSTLSATRTPPRTYERVQCKCYSICLYISLHK